MLKDVKPMAPRRTLVTGGNGQVGLAIQKYVEERHLDGFEFVDSDTFDITNPAAYENYDWDLYGTIINTAAFTAVDKAETPDGRKAAWNTNVNGVANLAKVATHHGITLVHISSDYVFDGTTEQHTEDEGFAPLGVYGETKAAADAIVSTVPRHYIIRSSWIVGDGANFVMRMITLAQEAVKTQKQTAQAPNDQFGRLTFVGDLVKGIFHLLNTNCTYGTYNLTGSGRVASWYDIASKIFELEGVDTKYIDANSVDTYAEQTKGSKRPHYCALDLSKIRNTGFDPADWEQMLKTYIADHKRNQN
jgi:dTDP-4-dehydrorhamnose 3,5-epimerase/reductase